MARYCSSIVTIALEKGIGLHLILLSRPKRFSGFYVLANWIQHNFKALCSFFFLGSMLSILLTAPGSRQPNHRLPQFGCWGRRDGCASDDPLGSGQHQAHPDGGGSWRPRRSWCISDQQGVSRAYERWRTGQHLYKKRPENKHGPGLILYALNNIQFTKLNFLP